MRPKSQTTQLYQLLLSHPSGAKKQDLMCRFYEDFAARSEAQRVALDQCFNKLLQRLKHKLNASEHCVRFCKQSKVWRIESTSCASGAMITETLIVGTARERDMGSEETLLATQNVR